MAKPQMTTFWRTTTLTAWGQVDFGSDQTVGCLALRFAREGNSIVPTTGNVQHLLDADGGTPGTGLAYDSGAVALNTDADYGYHLNFPGSDKTARYWRFQFSAVSGVTFIDVSRAWAGNVFQPTLDIGFPYDEVWGDLSVLSLGGRSGTEWVDDRPMQLAFGIQLGAIEASDAVSVKQMMLAIGISKQILFCKDPTDGTSRKLQTVIGRRSENRALSKSLIANPALYSTRLLIRESL